MCKVTSGLRRGKAHLEVKRDGGDRSPEAVDVRAGVCQRRKCAADLHPQRA